MVTFVVKADRRVQGLSKDTLTPKEAAILCQRPGIRFAKADLEGLLTNRWEKKLQKYITADEGAEVQLDTLQLRQLAVSAASAFELAQVIITHFRGAGKALIFITGRMKNHSLDQNLVIPEAHVEKMIGPLWQERLKAANVTWSEAVVKEEKQMKLPLKPLYAFVERALQVQEVIERTGADPRAPSV